MFDISFESRKQALYRGKQSMASKQLTAESGLQLLARLSARPSLAGLDRTLFPDDLQPGDVVQLSGSSGTGKSFLLLQLLAKCLLPRTHKQLNVGGLGVGVVLIDTDHNISVLKLAELMESFVMNSVRNATGEDSVRLRAIYKSIDMEEIVKESLKNLIVLKTYSSLQLHMNFQSLGKILTCNSNISLLMIDSITAYYWQDTMSARSYRKMDLYLKVVIDKLQKCIKDFKIVTIFVKQEYFQSKLGDTKLPQITHKIDLRKTDKTNDLFCALIDSVQSSCQYTISDKGLQWIIQ